MQIPDDILAKLAEPYEIKTIDLTGNTPVKVSEILLFKKKPRHSRLSEKGYLPGCYLQNNRWRARIYFGKKLVHLGSFETQHEAHQAFLKAKWERERGYVEPSI